jgi:outer membrane biosynthesis protein TonB
MPASAQKQPRRHAMPRQTSQPPRKSVVQWTTLCASVAALIAGCATRPPEAPPAQAPVAAKPAPAPAPQAALPAPQKISSASTPPAYRRDAASHLYAYNGSRIYSGKMPPLLYAVGVLQVEIDGRGNVLNISWMRKPSQAPEVVAEIERTVRQASPFPAPTKMGRVTYTDTWLWHKSGRFQLDTLTEGQM